MIPEFENLSQEERDALFAAPIWISILVAGADGEFDREERRWTDRLVKVKSFSKPRALNPYYKEVGEHFWTKIESALAELPADPNRRAEILNERLAKLNDTLAKLPQALGAGLYKSWLTIADEAARASGGFLRIGSISAAEARWIHLPMLQPIAMPQAAEETPEDAED
ncbi:MAG: hypothetical protein ACK4NS_00125 [Saprospiraceae bacterium]